MSIITVQLGQCGNQIGSHLFRTISEDLDDSSSVKRLQGKEISKKEKTAYQDASVERFFDVRENGEMEARAVMVDMEQKVVNQMKLAAKRSGKWKYSDSCSFSQKRGSGNNWAHGYCGHGPVVAESVMNLVRKQVEKCDHLGGFLCLLSLAGGTGSGVGTYVSQSLREEFPHCFILNQVVWPYNMGEVIIQNYNAVLTLSHLYQCCDGILIMENDHLQKICSQLLALSKVSFDDLNLVISHQMAALFQPSYKTSNPGKLISNPLGDILEHTVSHPAYKLLNVRSIPQLSESAKQYSAYQWPGLLKHLRQMLISNSPMEEGIDWTVRASAGISNFNHSVANLLITRGSELQNVTSGNFSDANLYPSWMPPGAAFTRWQHPYCFHDYNKMAVLLSNSQSVVSPLDGTVAKAWGMFASRAYVHQYTKHGLTESDFMDSFASLEQVVHDYQHLL